MTRSRTVKLEAEPIVSDGQNYVLTDYDGHQHRFSLAGMADDAVFLRAIAKKIAAIADKIEKQAT